MDGYSRTGPQIVVLVSQFEQGFVRIGLHQDVEIALHVVRQGEGPLAQIRLSNTQITGVLHRSEPYVGTGIPLVKLVIGRKPDRIGPGWR